MEIEVITTGTGYFKAGLRAKVINITSRDIFPNECRKDSKMTIPEFTLVFPNGNKREFCQFQRDFVLA